MNKKPDLPPNLTEYAGQLAKLQQENAVLTAKVKWYEEQFRLAQHRRFGASSEKTPSDQMEMDLFNEAEALAAPAAAEPDLETVTYRRKKAVGGREAKLDQLPVETVVYELPLSEQFCSCCQHPLHEMSWETRVEIAVIPAQAKVIRRQRRVYGCRRCEQQEIHVPIVTAPMPQPVYPGSLASPSILAHVMSQKYVDAQPLYRQEQQFARLGLELSRQTLANWVIYGAQTWLALLTERMHHHLLQQDILHADETVLQVLREPGKAAQTDSYLWLYRSGRDGKPIVLYEYQPTRAGEHPKRFLSGFKGYLHVDGYSGYRGGEDITLVGCWAHARRKFDEALKTLSPASKEQGNTAAGQGLAFCNRLFEIERELKDATPEKRYTVRLEKSKPHLDAYLSWLKTQKARALPKSALNVAIQYSLNQWEKLTAFLRDGRLEIDNNRSERSIKPVVIGRKNWLFANTPRGAAASAIVYSVIETAKANDLHPFE